MENNNHHIGSDERPVSKNIRYPRGTGSVDNRYNTLWAEHGSDGTIESADGALDKNNEFDSAHLPAESIDAFRCIGAWSTSDNTNLTAENGRISHATTVEMNAFTHEIILEHDQSEDPWVGIDLIMRDIVTMGSTPRMRTRPFPMSGHSSPTMMGLSPSVLTNFTGAVERSRTHICGYQVFTKRVGRTLSAAAVLAAAIVFIAFSAYGADISPMAIYALLLLLAAVLTALQRFW